MGECQNGFRTGSVALPNYLDWRAAQRSYTDLALARRESFNLSYPASSGTAPERVGGATVSANFLPVLGMKPELGRNFTEAEDTPGGPKAALLGDALWRRRFGANPAVLGQRVTVDGVPREIIGVLPPEVGYPRASEIFLPLGDLRQDKNLLNRGNHVSFRVLGRLRPGVTPAAADADLGGIARELERRYPENNAGRGVFAQPLLDASVGDYRQSLLLLLGAVGCVLLIACANVANLQLARATGRAKELAVRAALGAGRWRLVRQTLTESVLLGLLGGAAGVLLAMWVLDGIVALSPAGVPRFHEARLDLAALGFTAAAALLAGVLAGAWPAWRVSGAAAMAATLHEGGARGGTGGRGQGRARAVLVVAQVALAVVLLTGAGLTLRSFYQVQGEPLGFRPNGVLTVGLALPSNRYDRVKFRQFYAQLLERVRALPGVAAAAACANVPFGDSEWDSSFHITGTPPAAPGQEPVTEMNVLSPGYFKLLGIPLLRGRDFGPQDTDGQLKSIIIDEIIARKYFPNVDPIGQHIDDEEEMPESHLPPRTIIGVAAHTRNRAPGEADFLSRAGQIHLCQEQSDTYDETLLVRAASGDPKQFVEPIRRIVLALDRDIPLAEVTTLEASIADSLASRRLTMTLLAAFAGVALLLAAVGLYGVMALSVTQRTRELGIRMALGASRAAVLRMVMTQGAVLVGIGLAAGLLAALAGGRALATLLYGVSGHDLPTLGVVTLTLAAAALLACWLPARRATRVDPMVALRED